MRRNVGVGNRRRRTARCCSIWIDTTSATCPEGSIAKQREQTKNSVSPCTFSYIRACVTFWCIHCRGGILRLTCVAQWCRSMDVPYPFDTKSTKAKLLLQAQTISAVQQRLQIDAPEVAFIGRSNSGKSTLINALLDLNPSHMQHSKTSNRPGETKDLIFYGTGPRPK